MNRVTQQFIADVNAKCDSTQVIFEQLRNHTSQPGARRVLSVGIQITKLLRRTFDSELKSSPYLNDDEIIERGRSYIDELIEVHDFMVSLVSPIPDSSFPDEWTPYIHETLDTYGRDYALVILPSNKEDVIAIWMLRNYYQEIVNYLAPYVPDDMLICEYSNTWILVLEFPVAESRMFPIHPAILGHELMHFDEEINEIGARLVDTSGVRIPDAWMRPLISDLGETDAADKTLEVLLRWLSEIISDLLAIHMFGPCAFESFARVSLFASPLNESSETHPDPVLRLSLMFQELSYLGYLAPRRLPTNAQRANTLGLRQYLREWQKMLQIQVTPTDSVEELVRRVISRPNSVRAIQDAVRSHTTVNSYSVEQYADEVPMLTRAFQSGTPSAERIHLQSRTVVPATTAGILNAGFSVWREHRTEFVGEYQDPNNDQDSTLPFLSRLLLKAVEARRFYELLGLDMNGFTVK